VDLLIVGASARAAAFSALRIGLQPTCIDLFADADLAALCPVHRVESKHYPDGLTQVAESLPPMPWLYTGALENRPDLLDRISLRHRRLGNAGDSLRAVRDPMALADAFRDYGLNFPEVRIDPTGLPLEGSWLRKPISSAGGRNISPWTGQVESRRPVYYQERIDGLPLSAIFVGQDLRARCLGISRQYIGKFGNRFAYRGSLAPWPVSPERRDRVEQLGQAVVGWFGLEGLFGVDLILNDDAPWPVEVNPRYTASVEVLEWASGRSLLADHLLACGFDSPIQEARRQPIPFVAKAILFASHRFSWPSNWVRPAGSITEFSEVADIPQPGSSFEPGDPVITLLAKGHSAIQCQKNLAGLLRTWRLRIKAEADRPTPRFRHASEEFPIKPGC